MMVGKDRKVNAERGERGSREFQIRTVGWGVRREFGSEEQVEG